MDCETLGADSETGIVQLWKRIVKLWGWTVKLGWCNSEGGLWKFWGRTDCETGIVKLRRRILKLWGRIVKLVLWKSAEGWWIFGWRLFHGYCEPWWQIRKLWNSKLHNQSLKSQNATSKFHNPTFENRYKSWNSLPCCSRSLAPFFSRLRPNSFPQLQDAPRQGLHSRRRGTHQFEVPWGWEFSYHLNLVEAPSQFEVPWGWEFWYHLNFAETPSQFEVPWGWEFWYHLRLVKTTNQFAVPWVVGILISS